MNNKEEAINKVDELVNRAQLAINDWQCSGDVDCLEKAAAYLRAALELARAARAATLTDQKAEAYSVDYDDMTSTLCDTPKEALESARDNLKDGEIVAVVQWRKSNWHPEISVAMLLGEFENLKRKRAKMVATRRNIGANVLKAGTWPRLAQSWDSVSTLS